jgi:hypothetical protein
MCVNCHEKEFYLILLMLYSTIILYALVNNKPRQVSRKNKRVCLNGQIFISDFINDVGQLQE